MPILALSEKANTHFQSLAYINFSQALMLARRFTGFATCRSSGYRISYYIYFPTINTKQISECFSYIAFIHWRVAVDKKFIL
jgi:hypothetical protein